MLTIWTPIFALSLCLPCMLKRSDASKRTSASDVKVIRFFSLLSNGCNERAFLGQRFNSLDQLNFSVFFLSPQNRGQFSKELHSNFFFAVHGIIRSYSARLNSPKVDRWIRCVLRLLCSANIFHDDSAVNFHQTKIYWLYIASLSAHRHTRIRMHGNQPPVRW